MKIRPLPPIDLARAAAARPEARERILRAHKGGRPVWSYDPVRRREDDLLNAQARLLPPMDDTPWDAVTARIWRDCRGDQIAFNSNLEVAKLTYDYVREKHVRAILEPFSAFDLGLGGLAVSYWAKSVLIINDEPCIAFFDHRRSKGLSGGAVEFACSIMHHNIRSQYGDLTNASLAIINFPQVTTAKRKIEVHIQDKAALSLSDLRVQISDTYAMWNAICLERVEEERGRGGKK